MRAGLARQGGWVAEMNKPDLLPCPFCGGQAELWRAHNSKPAWIACMGRCVVLVTRDYQSDAEAIAAWNRRAGDE